MAKTVKMPLSDIHPEDVKPGDRVRSGQQYGKVHSVMYETEKYGKQVAYLLRFGEIYATLSRADCAKIEIEVKNENF